MDQNNFSLNKISKIKTFIYLLPFFLCINKILCLNCYNIADLLDTNCYNHIIEFNNDVWRAGRASTNKKGEMIIEFSLNKKESSSRLFYGLKKNGRYFFPEEPYFKEIEDIQCEGCDTNSKYKGRLESRNLFLSLTDDTTKSKQYLFSMSAGYSLVELIDIENNFTYFTWNSTNFFDLTKPIFSFEYPLFELEDSNTFITAFMEVEGYDTQYNFDVSNSFRVMKFTIKNFNSNNNRLLFKSEKINDVFNGRAISAFRLDKTKLIIVLAITKESKIYFYYYNDNLDYQGNKHFWDLSGLWGGFGVFIKGISLIEDRFAIAFFRSNTDRKTLIFQLMKYKDMNNNDIVIHKYEFSSYEFRPEVRSSELYKINDDRLALFTVSDYNQIEFAHLHLFLLDFYNNYEGMKMREYKFYYPDKIFAKEVSVHVYYDYLLFSATLGNSNNHENTFAIIMILGFANGTDSTIDIYPYLMDTGDYDVANNLYDYLIGTMSIDNNIFGYENYGKIKLVSICDELLLYKGKLNISKEENTITINDLFDANHTLLQNRNIEKEENKLYSLEYQFMVKEPDYVTFYSTSIFQFSSPSNYDGSQYYKQNIFEGRTNILKFKLCHKYCIKCNEYGVNDNDQRCLNCKEEYTYDYLMNVGRFNGNCVPYDQMYDEENKTLTYCNTTEFKYYYNKTRNNERYCFKYDYDCPDDYPYLNTTSNECLNYTPPVPTTFMNPIPSTNFPIPKTTITIKTPSTVLTQISTTSKKIIPTTAINKIQETTLNTIPTTKNIIHSSIIPKLTINSQIQSSIKLTETTHNIFSTTKETSIPLILTTIPEIINTITSNQEKCKYGLELNYTSFFSNLTIDEIYQITKTNIISNYCFTGSRVDIEGSEFNSFQVSNTAIEKQLLQNGDDSFAIDLNECEIILKDNYNISDIASLIIL